MKVLKGNYLVAGSAGLMGATALLRLCNLEGVTIRATYRNRKSQFLRITSLISNGFNKF